MRPVAIILAACALALMSADLRAEDRHRSAWPEEEETRSRTPISKWLPSVLGSNGDADGSDAADSEPAASQQAAPARKQQPRRRAPEPEPEPEPKLTPEEQEAEDRWWKEIGDPAVLAFSRCLQEHVVDEITAGNESSYPDFVTSAMNTRCSREFSSMAKLILERHGEDSFARVARKLIADKFVPAVKQVVEGGPEVVPPEDDRPKLEAEMRQSKEAMFSCFVDNSDRLAAGSAATPDEIADLVITACQTPAKAYFGKLEQLYPRAAEGKATQNTAAILKASYRPAIIERIASVRADPAAGASGGKADAEAVTQKRQDAVSRAPAATFTPADEPAQRSPDPASSRP